MGRRILGLTHGLGFHLDEILALVMIKNFYLNPDDEFTVIRVDHQAGKGSELQEKFKDVFDEVIVVDVGREHDEDKLLFDHHQYKKEDVPFAAAGLVRNWLYSKNLVPESIRLELDMIVELADNHDLGIEKARPGELPYDVALMNADDPFGKEQFNAFNKALKYVYTIVNGLKRKGEKLDKAKDRILEETVFANELNKEENGRIWRVLEFVKGYIPAWTDVLPTLPRPYTDVDIVMWYDENQDRWKAQIVPVHPDSYEGRNRTFPDKDVDGKIFIHSNGFFCVFKTREDLVNYLKSL